jgi:Cupin superfamily protein
MVTSPNGGWREAVTGRPPFDLARLIHPLSVSEFLSEYWEKQPLLLRRNDPDYYSDLLTLEDMDRIISTSAVRSSDLRVLSEGKEIPVEQLTSPQTGGHAGALEALFDAYRNGATINLTFLHERYEPRACPRLQLRIPDEHLSDAWREIPRPQPAL